MVSRGCESLVASLGCCCCCCCCCVSSSFTASNAAAFSNPPTPGASSLCGEGFMIEIVVGVECWLGGGGSSDRLSTLLPSEWGCELGGVLENTLKFFSSVSVFQQRVLVVVVWSTSVDDSCWLIWAKLWKELWLGKFGRWYARHGAQGLGGSTLRVQVSGSHGSNSGQVSMLLLLG